jgi:hypothetical protein
MSDDWSFRAVGSTAEVTALLNEKNARTARVAATGQEAQNAKYGVWYVRTNDDDNEWQLSQVAFDLNSTVDTDSVTKILEGSETAAVTFFGQDKKYYVWWRED